MAASTSSAVSSGIDTNVEKRPEATRCVESAAAADGLIAIVGLPNNVPCVDAEARRSVLERLQSRGCGYVPVA